MTDISTAPEQVAHSVLGDYLALSEATKRIPRFNGKRIHPSTIYRWTVNGCKGVHLDHWRIGRKIVTTEAALHKFFAELVQIEAAGQPATAASRVRRSRHRAASTTRQREIEAANEVLVRAGILKPQTIDYKD